MAASTPSPATALQARGFRAWVLGDVDACQALSLSAMANLSSGAARSAADVATLGYVATVTAPDHHRRDATLGGLAWLAERTWFRAHQPLTLEADGVSALGIALAFRALEPSAKKDWLRDLVVRSATAPDLADLDRSLFIVAAHVIGAPGRQDLSTVAPEVQLVTQRLDIGSPAEGTFVAAWHHALRFSGGIEVVPEAALLLAALNEVTERNLPARLGRLEAMDVLRVLEGVPRSFKRWPWEATPRTVRSALARWDIENEYHVQDMLWAVLAPLFPDLNDEETLPPVGQKNPRVDLSIRSLATIIEVKFVRDGKPFQDTIEEIAADASLYATDPRWKHLIPFVWDDSRRAEEHAKLLAGLKQLTMVAGAVVMSRPGRMIRSLTNSNPNRAASASPPSSTDRGRKGP